MINPKRLTIANQIMALLFPASNLMQLAIASNRICLQWQGKQKKWECRNGSWYPTIAHQIPTGGTHIQALLKI
jgi:hypothetical protein